MGEGGGGFWFQPVVLEGSGFYRLWGWEKRLLRARGERKVYDMWVHDVLVPDEARAGFGLG